MLHLRTVYYILDLPIQRLRTHVEPLPLKTPVFLFRDEETGEITAIEVLDTDEALGKL